MTVSWALPAKYRLKEIYLYYKHAASTSVAKSLVRKIFETTRALSSHPKMGNTEELLKHKNEEYRYLVKGNYKIIYKTTKDGGIYITDVFDCRQNPEKMKAGTR